MTKHYFDNTRMSDYQECPRKYAIRHLWDLVPNRKSMPLYFGSTMHDCLSKWYETGDVKEALTVWDEYEDNQWDEKRTKSRGTDIAISYFATYPSEPFKIISNEMPFEVHLVTIADDEYYLMGKIDLAIEWNNAIYVVDHKTTSQLGGSYFKQFKPSRQMPGYCIGLSKLLDKTVSGAFINALAVYKSKTKYERSLITYTPRKLVEYTLIIPQLMQRMVDTEKVYKRVSEDLDDKWTALNHSFLPNWDSCYNWGGCQYRDLCNANGAKSVVETGYREEHWDPREEFAKDA